MEWPEWPVAVECKALGDNNSMNVFHGSKPLRHL